MKFNSHKQLEGFHAPFSPSQSAWLRYSDTKTKDFLSKRRSKEIGTRLHEWAAETIKLGIKQPDTDNTLYAYVNDGIGFKMNTEVVLYYSDYFFGTADTISFRDSVLRIHDLKTGEVGKIESHVEQVEVYAALFCLEYKIKPEDIEMELRIYKLDDVLCHKPDPKDIRDIMNKIIYLNKIAEKIDYEEV